MGVGCRRPGWNSSRSARCREGASRIGFVIKRPARGKPWRGDWGASPQQLYGLDDDFEHVPDNREECHYFGGGIVIDHKQMPPPRHYAAESGMGIIGTLLIPRQEKRCCVREKKFRPPGNMRLVALNLMINSGTPPGARSFHPAALFKHSNLPLSTENPPFFHTCPKDFTNARINNKAMKQAPRFIRQMAACRIQISERRMVSSCAASAAPVSKIT